MKIGILTFYRVANFGANLQAVSTYYYLKKHGHEPVFILYESEETTRNFQNAKGYEVQKQEHLHFVDAHIGEQTRLCRNTADVNAAIKDYGIEAGIIGSDAVLQHHPLITRIHKGRRKPFFVSKVVQERMFPNVFWGVGFDNHIPIAMMSVSSQNSGYKWFSKRLKKSMAESLLNVRYLSVRDTWTKQMVESILQDNTDIPVTPDPVFAFNSNAGELIPTEADIRQRFRLPQKYVLVSLHKQDLTMEQLDALKDGFRSVGMDCVAFPMPTGIKFKHGFDYEIGIPLNPIDWYALIKYSSAYVGSNMHPIVVSLHNAVPCFSIDNWGRTDFWGRKKQDDSSKVQHILGKFDVAENHAFIQEGKCDVSVAEIVNKIQTFPTDDVKRTAKNMLAQYEEMMNEVLIALNGK